MLYFYLAALALTGSSNAEATSGPLLRKESVVVNQQADKNVLLKLLERIEALETSSSHLEARVNNQGIRIEELEETIEDLRSKSEEWQRNLQVNPPVNTNCDFTFNQQTQQCTSTNNFAFGGPVDFNEFVNMNEGAEVFRTFTSTAPTMLNGGLDVSGGLISLDSRVQMGNMTADGTIFVGKVFFTSDVEAQAPSLFRDSVTFEEGQEVCFESNAIFKDEVTFEDYVLFHGDEEVEFEVDVTFRDDVKFKDDVEFQDDVAIKGPSTSHDSSSSIDFEIMGYVNVDFKMKKPFDVYPESRFRDDVHLIHGSSSDDDSSDSSTSTTTSGEEDDDTSKSTSDYSSESHDTAPKLRVAGDITAESDLKVEGDLHVEGTTTLEGDVTVDGGDLSIMETVTDDDAVPVIGGDLTVGGATTLMGGIVGDLAVGGATTLTGGVDGDLTVGGATTLTGGVDAGLTVNDGGLTVSGTSTLNGFVNVDAGPGVNQLSAAGTITAAEFVVG